MVKLFELSETARKVFISDVLTLLKDKYHVDEDSINEFLEYYKNGTTKTQGV